MTMHAVRRWQLGILAIASTTWFAPLSTAQKDVSKPAEPIVGVGQSFKITPNLDDAVEGPGASTWTSLIRLPGAAFLKLHFVDVNLRPGDVLTVWSKAGNVVEEITGRGPKQLGNFWALSAYGDELTLDFSFQRPYEYLPFHTDEIIVGDPISIPTQEPESICTPGDFEDVFCYQSDTGKWNNIFASVGVMSVGGNPTTALFCSGSNVSPLNYILTNEHCVSTQAECDSTEFVFKFYRTGCNDGSPTTVDWQSFRCNQIVSQLPFISCDQGLADLDFSLCSVIGDPASTYGFVDPDPTPLTDGEGIYIVQHPAGRPHEITHGSGANVDVDGTVLRYYDTLDTEGGSSGSPIFRESDDRLIGLHHCGGCSTPGTGNRGMLMSDIYPLIQSFLCTPTLSVSAAGTQGFAEVSGNGDAVVDPGETWEFSPQIRNGACNIDALSVTADIQVNPASTAAVTLLDTTADFGNVLAGANATSTSPIRFTISSQAACNADVIFDMVNLSASNGGPFSDTSGVLATQLGNVPFTTVFFEDFASGLGTWNVLDGGTGTGPAQTWTTANPGARSLSLTAPFVIADSDEHGTGNLMDETLTSQAIDLTNYSVVMLQFTHDFNYYEFGLVEQADVEVRSNSSGGWVNVANYTGSDTSGTQMIDISSIAAGQPNVRVRFRYSNADFEFWWAIDDVFVLGSNGNVCDDSFTAFGTGCAGTGGFVPTLDGVGSATSGGEVSLQITNGLPDGSGLLFVSNTSNPGAGPCSFLIGLPASFVLPVGLDSSGNASLTGNLGDVSPVNFNLYFQYLGIDSGAVTGNFSFSNGLDMFVH